MILFAGEVHLGTSLTILSKEKDKTSEGRSVCLTYDWLRLSGHGNSNQAEVNPRASYPRKYAPWTPLCVWINRAHCPYMPRAWMALYESLLYVYIVIKLLNGNLFFPQPNNPSSSSSSVALTTELWGSGIADIVLRRLKASYQSRELLNEYWWESIYWNWLWIRG